jgi:hypothetical protein
MTQRFTELSSYLRRKSREPRSSNHRDLSEDENFALAVVISVAALVSLAVAFVTVLIIVARAQ